MVAELPQGVRLRQARTDEHDAIVQLAQASGLTTEGPFATVGQLSVAEAAGDLIGAVGLEQLGDDALLRATCIHEAWRGRGIGSALVEHALTEAALEAIGAVYLRTSTAARFFARFGFIELSATALPFAVVRTFSRDPSPSPATIAMQLTLGPR